MSDSEFQKKARGNPNWVQGVSANPGGRPKSALTSRMACRALNDKTLSVLVQLLDDADGDLRFKAACRIRDEANGKPVPMTELPADEQLSLDQIGDEQLLAMANEVLKKD